MPRGRPRKKDVKMFCLDGGESEAMSGETVSMGEGPTVVSRPPSEPKAR